MTLTSKSLHFLDREIASRKEQMEYLADTQGEHRENHSKGRQLFLKLNEEIEVLSYLRELAGDRKHNEDNFDEDDVVKLKFRPLPANGDNSFASEIIYPFVPSVLKIPKDYVRTTNKQFTGDDMKAFGDHCRVVMNGRYSETAMNALLDTWIENRNQ